MKIPASQPVTLDLPSSGPTTDLVDPAPSQVCEPSVSDTLTMDTLVINNNDAKRSLESCVLCSEEAADDCIQCDSCSQFFHLRCCGVIKGLFKTVSNIIHLLGWSCVGCKSDLRAELKSLRQEITVRRRDSYRLSE